MHANYGPFRVSKSYIYPSNAGLKWEEAAGEAFPTPITSELLTPSHFPSIICKRKKQTNTELENKSKFINYSN